MVTKRKLILSTPLCPGDVLMFSAAIRDLHHNYPNKFLTDVRVKHSDIFLNNPLITKISNGDKSAEKIEMHYPLIKESNQKPFHFIHGYRMFLEKQLGLPIKQGEFKGDIYLTENERAIPSQVDNIVGKKDTPFWIILSGGKYDFTTKWWDEERHQEVVDYFKDRLLFVQVGDSRHNHPPLRNVINLVGKTTIRELIRLMYHADGVICPITFAMHLAAAVPIKEGKRESRPCIVLAGGRESPSWAMYPNHQFIHTVGMLPCCAKGGCWKNRTVPLGDGDKKDLSLCLNPIKIREDKWLPKCLDMIHPQDVIRAIEGYLEYNKLKGKNERNI